MTEPECDCSNEHGPCEQHCQVIIQREGASLRSADELAVQYLEDAQELVPDRLSPYGYGVLRRAQTDLAKSGAWLSQRTVTSDELYSLVDQVETEVGVAGYQTYREDGYSIVKITGGPLLEA